MKIILVYALILSTPLLPTQCDDVIGKICKETQFYDLCVSSLRPVFQTPAPDVKALASTMAHLVLSNATDTLIYIQELIKETKDPDLEKPLDVCAELYIPVVKYNLPQAIDALTGGRFGYAKYAISDAAKQADDCEKGFNGSNHSPLTQRNNLLSSLSAVAVSIISTLLNASLH